MQPAVVVAVDHEADDVHSTQELMERGWLRPGDRRRRSGSLRLVVAAQRVRRRENGHCRDRDDDERRAPTAHPPVPHRAVVVVSIVGPPNSQTRSCAGTGTWMTRPRFL